MSMSKKLVHLPPLLAALHPLHPPSLTLPDHACRYRHELEALAATHGVLAGPPSARPDGSMAPFTPTQTHPASAGAGAGSGAGAGADWSPFAHDTPTPVPPPRRSPRGDGGSEGRQPRWLQQRRSTSVPPQGRGRAGDAAHHVGTGGIAGTGGGGVGAPVSPIPQPNLAAAQSLLSSLLGALMSGPGGGVSGPSGEGHGAGAGGGDTAGSDSHDDRYYGFGIQGARERERERERERAASEEAAALGSTAEGGEEGEAAVGDGEEAEGGAGSGTDSGGGGGAEVLAALQQLASLADTLSRLNAAVAAANAVMGAGTGTGGGGEGEEGEDGAEEEEDMGGSGDHAPSGAPSITTHTHTVHVGPGLDIQFEVQTVPDAAGDDELGLFGTLLLFGVY